MMPDDSKRDVRVGEGSTGDPAEIALIIAAMESAAEAVERGDPEGVAAMFADTTNVTSFDVLKPGVSTVDDIRHNVATAADNAAGPIHMRYPAVTVHVVSDDFAWSLAYGEFAMTDKAGAKSEMLMSVTDIWRKIDGRWLAMHEHSSLPIDAATGVVIMRQTP